MSNSTPPPQTIDYDSQMQVSCSETEDEEGFFFGDFKPEEYDVYFINDGLQNVGVEFLCDTYNATKSWVEEGCKHTFGYLEPINDENNIFPNNGEQLTSDSPTSVDESRTNVLNSDECTEVKKEKTIEEELLSDVNKLIVDERTTENIIDTSINDKNNEKKDTTVNSETKQTIKKEISQPIKPSSWASLFKNTTPNENTNNVAIESPVILSVQMEELKVEETVVVVVNSTPQNSLSVIAMDHDGRAYKLADLISKLSPNYSRHHLQLRGLINRGNWCYINTTLQALLGISPISHFYKALKSFLNNKVKSTSTPLTDSMIAFFNEFEPINPKIPLKKQSDDLRAGIAFEPRCVYDVLPAMKSSLSEKGRQEDAEEFLSFLLNGIHDELVALQKLLQPKMQPLLNGNVNEEHKDEKNLDNEEESWEHVGPRNKSTTLRKAVISESLIKHMFGGVIRSSVHQTGVKESTTLQPFFTLQLDIQLEKIRTLRDAIECYFMKENLQGFTCPKTNTEVEASRRTSIEEMPAILIFHLKYFVFDRKGGCQKIHKGLEIPVDLEIPKDVLSTSLKNKLPNNMRNYKLHAVVYHHGKHAAGGHYTAAVHHGNPFGWVHFDDNNIKTVSVTQVLKHQQGCVPYLLFYERIQTR